jgi:hypothetical protein
MAKTYLRNRKLIGWVLMIHAVLVVHAVPSLFLFKIRKMIRAVPGFEDVSLPPGPKAPFSTGPSSAAMVFA